jgi:MFS family permease
MNTAYHRVLWRQVWGLAALLAAILFSWMAYGFYQPVILTKLGFIELAQSLGVIQGFLGAVIEPVVGAMSDRWMRHVGSRLPAISVGITLAGLLFVAIGLLLHSNIPVGLRWIIPVLMTFWVISMIIFRGPAIALLRQYAPTESLPAANSILTIVFGLVGAIGPIFGRIIEFLGAANTFLFGAVILIVGAILMWSTHPQSMINPVANSLGISALAPVTVVLPIPNQEHQFIRWMQIFCVGLGAGLVVNVLLRVCPPRLSESLFNIMPEYITVGILLVCTIVAIPLERLVKKWGMNRSMAISICLMIFTIATVFIFDFPVISILIVLLGGISMGLLFLTQVPWCLSRLPPQQAGLSTGLYFGGMGAATALLTLVLIK